MQLRKDMAKLLYVFIFLCVLELCLARRGYRPSHRRPGRQRDERRRHWRHFDSADDDDFFDGHGWGRRVMDR